MHGHPDTRHVRDGDDVHGRGDVRDRDDDAHNHARAYSPASCVRRASTPEHPERGANNDHCGNQLEPRFC